MIALGNTNIYAEDVEMSEVTELKKHQTEMLEVIEKVLNDFEIEQDAKPCMKIYNSKNQLVYECRDKEDARLKILLRRCDLVLYTDSSSYYLLGD